MILLRYCAVVLVTVFVTACGGGATSTGSASSNSTPSANNPSACSATSKFAYVSNSGSNNISVLNFNSATGALTTTTSGTFSPYTSAVNPVSVVIDPTCRFAYVPSNSSNNISAYAINSSTGALSQIAGSPLVTSTPNSIAIDPTGKYLYVANYNSHNVSAYTIDTSTGALTQITGSPFSVSSVPSTYPSYVAVDPNGRFLYVVIINYGISAYSINSTTGALSLVAGSPFANGSGSASAGGITINASGNIAYVADGNSATVNNVYAYSINAITGVLTQIVGSPVAAGSYATSVTIDPTGKFAYVPNALSNTVSVYTINSLTGVMSQIPGSPFATGTYPTSASIDPSGSYAYVSNANGNSISSYSINITTGALTPLPSSLFTATQLYAPWSVTF